MQVLLFWQMDILLLLQLPCLSLPPFDYAVGALYLYLCYLYESWSDI